MSDLLTGGTPFDRPQAPSPDEWRLACVPLGALRGEGAWSPLGAGVLFIDAPVLWLLTARSVLEAAGGAPVAAWAATTDGAGTMIDLTTGRPGTPLDWVRHPERDLAATVFPVGARLKLKAFAEAQTLPEEHLAPLARVAVGAFAFGFGATTQRPSPLAFDGAVAGVEARAILSSAALPSRSAGAPLLAQLPPQSGGGVALAGIATHAVVLPEPPTSPLPPVRLTVAAPIALAIALVRGEAGKAARAAAVAAGKGGA
ncbi:MAG: hypothetical protein M9894_25985 [Planctomycetes bacterium]|nr:hypothetical protein [Planctomycetota bacterium]